MAEATNGGGERKLVVLDTSVLLNFLKVGRLDLLVATASNDGCRVLTN